MKAGAEAFVGPSERPRAKDTYKSWPGLENPRASEPIHVAREIWEERSSKDRSWRWLHIALYRLYRTGRRALSGAGEELSAAPKRTLVEVALGLPIALLTVDPYRIWLLRWRYAWDAILGLVVVNFLYGVARRVYERRETSRRIAEASTFFQLIIECSRPHTKEGAEGVEPTEAHLRHTIAIVLQALADLVRQVLQVSDDVRVHANLMIPMPVAIEGDTQPRNGIGIVAYSLKRPAEPAWTRLMVTDYGAGEALTTGKVCVVEDTNDPKWRGVFRGQRARCFASFPVLQGSGKVVAVVNVDADKPLILTRSNAGNELYQAMVGPLALLADVLYNTRVVRSSRDAMRRGSVRR